MLQGASPHLRLPDNRLSAFEHINILLAILLFNLFGYQKVSEHSTETLLKPLGHSHGTEVDKYKYHSNKVTLAQPFNVVGRILILFKNSNFSTYMLNSMYELEQTTQQKRKLAFHMPRLD